MIEKKQLPIVVPAVFKYLNQNTTYAVLRNAEGLPYQNKSRDIDILIPRRQYESIKKELAKIIIDTDFRIISFFESERICTFVCGKVDTNTVNLVQFDFFFHTSAYGVILLNAEKALEVRVFDGNIYHVTKEYEFLDKYLYLKYIGKSYPAKYSTLEKLMSNNPCLDSIIEENFGLLNYSTLKNLSTKKFRRIINTRNKKLFLKKHILNKLFFRYCYLKNIISPKGYSIGFTGPDGVGKTTLIEQIQSIYSILYREFPLYHFRPTLIGNLGEVAHSAGLKKEVDRDYSKPHRGEKTTILSSLIRLLYYSIDYICGYFLQVRKFLCQRNIVIFDRYFTDVICDSRRSRIYLNYKFLYGFGKLFIPSLNYNILLTACTDTILARKKELDEEGIRVINEKIDYLADKKGYKKILNEQTPEVAVAEILSYIFENQHRKNLRRLK